MTAGAYCNREVVIAEGDTSAKEAAVLMRKFHVGDLVVVQKQGEVNIPVGIVTDRDLVIEIIAKQVPVESITIKDVMSADLITVEESKTLLDTLELMQNQGVRRVIVVDGQGSLQGLLTADDAIELMAEAMNNLTRLVKREITREEKEHP